MLDERKEYRLYLAKGYGGLFKRDNIKNGLAGLRPILICIARGFLELLEETGVESLAKKDLLTQEFLSCWLTGEYNISSDTHYEIVNEFKKAQKACLLDEIVFGQMRIRGLKDAERKTVKKFLTDKVIAFKKSMFYSSKKNSVNEIYFKAIIADALYKGKLKNQLLAIKNHKENFGIETSAEGLENLSNLLAIVATCLQNSQEGQLGCNVKTAQLSNVLNRPTLRKKKRDSAFSAVEGYIDGGYTYNGRPIILKQQLVGGVVKLVLNEEWVNEFNPHLLDFNAAAKTGYKIFTNQELLPNVLN